MKKAIKVRHVAEIWNKTGPTGKFAEVFHGELHDFGGNVIYFGTADNCLKEKDRIGGPFRLVPTDWHELDGEVADADYVWQFVMR